MLEVRALGPLAVLRDGQALELGKGNERALLALLALHTREPLSSDAIVDELWGERPPPTAPEMVRNYVARARKRLGEDAIATLPTGYQLVVDPSAVDLLTFERLARDGGRALETGNPEAAATSLAQALELWRGRPLPELDFTPAGEVEVGRLEELRLRAIEDRNDAELALGRSRALVPELERLVKEHPHRERLLAQLMLALYRCGRQKDALERYQSARHQLIEEVGLEPGPELQQLQQAILRHDPELTVQPLTDAVASQPVGHARPARRRAGILAAAAATLAAAIAVPLVLLTGGSSVIALSRRSLAELDLGSGAPRRSVSLGSAPGPIAVTGNAVWIGIGAKRPAALEVDQRTFRIVRIVRLDAAPYQLAAGGGALWVGNGFDGTLTRIDSRGLASRPFRPEQRATGRLPLAYGLGSLWVGSQDNTVSRLDPRTDRTLAVIRGVRTPNAIATGFGGVWVAEASQDLVVHIDPRTNRVARTIPIGGLGSDIAAGDGAVWVVTPGEGRVWRINPLSNAVTAAIEVGGEPVHVAAGEGAVWLATSQGTLVRIDARTNQTNRVVNLNRPVGALVGSDGRLWVTLP
jgi:DNA-binding SARP family transcriptional activator/streptogramin lyase